MVDAKKAGMAALGITALSYGLGFVYKKWFAGGIATITFSSLDVNVANQIKAGIDTSLAGKVLSYLNGVIPIDGTVAALLTLFVASFAVVYLAGWLAEQFSFFGKSETQKFGVSLAASAFLIGLALGTTSVSIGALGTGIAMLIYFGIIAVIYSYARTVDGIKDFFPQP